MLQSLNQPTLLIYSSDMLTFKLLLLLRVLLPAYIFLSSKLLRLFSKIGPYTAEIISVPTSF